jgi:hypothetical protein
MSAREVIELSSYFPVDAVIRDGKPQIEWLNMSDVEFTEPFFQQTVERARQSNAHDSVFTDLDTLLQVAKAGPAVQPSGLIFHTSRCGSTLVANACRALDTTRVIAEAPVIDKLVSRLFTDAQAGSTKELLYLSLVRAAVQSLSRHRLNAIGRYFVKFGCASILHIKSLRRAWPDVPFLILFRHPIEVTVSNLQSRPEWMIADSNPGAAAAIVGVDIEQLQSITDEEFCARALGRWYAAAESVAADRLMLLVDYNQLSPQTITEIIRFFGVTPSAHELAAIEQSMMSHSKDPTRSFFPDSADKRAAASSQVIDAVERWALGDYERLAELSKDYRTRPV